MSYIIVHINKEKNRANETTDIKQNLRFAAILGRIKKNERKKTRNDMTYLYKNSKKIRVAEQLDGERNRTNDHSFAFSIPVKQKKSIQE